MAVPRDWFAGVKRAEVEMAALPGSGFFDHAMPVVEVVPSELSVDEHAELLAKAARVAWRHVAPRVQAAPQADWMNEEAWQAVRAHAVAKQNYQLQNH